MDILKDIEKKSILPVKEKYIFNNIYFGSEGLTSTSANHVSAMANLMANDIKECMSQLRLYRKYIRVIGEPETLVEDEVDILSEIPQAVESISKANSLVAWLREAIKERENAFNHINSVSIQDYAEMFNLQIPERPKQPVEPNFNPQDLVTILGKQLTIKEYNRVLELNSTLAVYGYFIHENGLLTNERKQLQKIHKNPIEVKESGRDTIVERYEPNCADGLDKVYTELQAKYRKLQAEKNGIDKKMSDVAVEYQIQERAKYEAQLEEWKGKCAEWDAQFAELKGKWMMWKKQECERIAALKIIIPNDLIGLYTELRDKYM